MSKIVQAINSMISNKEHISNICLPEHVSREEYFFEYKGKYVWSLARLEDGDFWLYLYPHATSSNGASEVEDFSNYPMVAYGDNDLRSREARDSVSELFSILKSKLYNVDSVLDDIISDDLMY